MSSTNLQKTEFTFTDEVKQKLELIALQSQDLKKLDFNSSVKKEFKFISKTEVRNSNDSLIKNLPEKDFIQINFFTEKGNYTALIDLNQEKLIGFYRITPIVIK